MAATPGRRKLADAVGALLLAATLAAGAASAGSRSPDVPAPGAVHDDVDVPAPLAAPAPDRVDAMRAAAKDLLGSLKAELEAALGREDLGAAVAACREHAVDQARRVSLANGWRVTRVSLKPRNALLGMPDAWEQKQLLAFDAAVAAGADPATMEVAAVVAEPAGDVVRYMKALPTSGMCVTCHGPADALPAPIRKTLDQHYPHDRAVGYAPGMIRGAVSIKAPR